MSPIGFGAFKIGRNEGIKYPQGYDLPDDARVERLLNEVLDLGINYVDTAPAYGEVLWKGGSEAVDAWKPGRNSTVALERSPALPLRGRLENSMPTADSISAIHRGTLIRQESASTAVTAGR